MYVLHGLFSNEITFAWLPSGYDQEEIWTCIVVSELENLRDSFCKEEFEPWWKVKLGEQFPSEIQTT